MEKHHVFELIEKIAPLNNKYRDLIKNGERGVEVLKIMWDTGEIIIEFLQVHDVKPHNLYWKIYGKAEGIKVSYITRDFLSYCVRIRSYFSSKNEIVETFPRLRRYSLFREAFPLLENSKYKVTAVEKAELTKILNSSGDPSAIKKTIQDIKSKRIGIKNPRTQKLDEMKPLANDFLTFYTELTQILKLNDVVAISKIRAACSPELFNTISQATSALTQENLFVPELPHSTKLPDSWIVLLTNLKFLSSSQIEVRNRFRRLMPPKKLFDLADMIDALKSDNGIINYRKRKGI